MIPGLTKTTDAVTKRLKLLQNIALERNYLCNVAFLLKSFSVMKNCCIERYFSYLNCKELLNDVTAELTGFAGGDNAAFLHGVVVVGLLSKVQVLFDE